MSRIKLKFDNADGQTLAGLLETPPDGVPVARYALFAHLLHLRQGHRRGVLTRTLSFEGDLTKEQRRRLIDIADRCPVHQTLEKEVRIETTADEIEIQMRNQDIER